MRIVVLLTILCGVLATRNHRFAALLYERFRHARNQHVRRFRFADFEVKSPAENFRMDQVFSPSSVEREMSTTPDFP